MLLLLDKLWVFTNYLIMLKIIFNLIIFILLIIKIYYFIYK